MSVAKTKLEWNVFYGNFNTKRIEDYNIFEHGGFRDDVIKAFNQHKNEPPEVFWKELRSILQYYFWAKCEWEIVLSDFPPSTSFKSSKVDVFEQVSLNIGKFEAYVWNALCAGER